MVERQIDALDLYVLAVESGVGRRRSLRTQSDRLIPDFIPVVGYLDDLVIVPLGILLAVKLVPADPMMEFRTAATSADGERALGKWGAAVILILWVAGLTLAPMWLHSVMRR